MSELTGILDLSIQNYGEKDCISDKKQRLTYLELEQNIHGTAFGLRLKDIKPGDHVALLLKNCVEYLILYFSLLKIGVVIVPIDFTSGFDRIKFILEDCNVHTLILQKDSQGSFMGRCNVLEVESLISLQQEAFDFPFINESAIACIMYTTGSTGNPKGVVLTHANVYSSLNIITQYMGYTDMNRELVALPITHSFGLNQILCNLMNGGYICLLHGFANSGRILRYLKSEKITNFPGTPTSYKMLLDNYLSQFKCATQTLHTILINSSPLSSQFARYILTEFPSTRLLVYYGLTEASRSTFHTHSFELSEKYLSSVGQASPNVEVLIMDESGSFLKTAEEGEVVVRSGTIMHSYWNNPKETEKNIKNKWFKTGDLGYLDEKGYLFLSGRIKDQINIGGLKASSVEIKKALESIGYIKEAFVFGKQDNLYGEIPVACINFKTPITKSDLSTLLDNKLEKFKIPHLFYDVKEIPKSITGKVLRVDLIESIKNEKPIA